MLNNLESGKGGILTGLEMVKDIFVGAPALFFVFVLCTCCCACGGRAAKSTDGHGDWTRADQRRVNRIRAARPKAKKIA